MKLAIVASHPVQYLAPLYRQLARRCELRVFYAYRPDPVQQGREGFGKPFAWDTDLFSGYAHEFLRNRSGDPRTDRFGGCNTPDIGRHLRDGSFDAVMVTGWNLQCYWQAIAAARRARIPVIVRGDSQLATRRSRITRVGKALAYPLLLKAFDAFCVVGQRNRAYLRHYGVPQTRLFDSPHAVDCDYFSAQAITVDVTQTRQKIGIPEGHDVALYVGKFRDFKRIPLLLEAATNLQVSGRPLHVVLAGAGPLEPDLREQAHRSGLSISFTGFLNQTELPALYAAADVLVLPSDGTETWGLVVNEAFACGTPAVVSELAGCAPDLIQTGLTGETFAGDVAMLSVAIRRVLARGKSAKVCAALRAACDRHSLDAAAAGILNAAASVTLGA